MPPRAAPHPFDAPGADWAAAAQLLVDGCAWLPQAQDRVRLLERLCEALGTALYPTLIGVLAHVGDRGTPAARAAVARTLMDGLCSGRVPSGRLAAWGTPTATAAGGAMRSLGPIEYLCAWYAQPGGPQALQAAEFTPALAALLRLVSEVDPARRLYCERLRSAADDPLDAALARGTRAGLRQLADTWQHCGADLDRAVAAFVGATQGTGLHALRSLAASPARLR